MILVTRADTSRLGYCHAGVRAYFARHQISWAQFLEAGVPVSALAHRRGDPMIERLIQAAEARGG